MFTDISTAVRSSAFHQYASMTNIIRRFRRAKTSGIFPDVYRVESVPFCALVYSLGKKLSRRVHDELRHSRKAGKPT